MVEGLSQFAPIFLRAIGLVAVLPFGDGLLLVTRSALALGLTVLFAGTAPLPGAPLDPYLVILELGIGVVLGLPAAILTECLAMAGELVDNGRGQNQANVYEPLHNQTVSYLALLGKHFTWYVFLALGVLPALVGNFARSLQVIPPATGVQVITAASMQVLLFLTEALGTTFLLFLPFGVLFLLVEIAAGFISKGSTRSGFSGESFLVKSALAFLLLLALQRFEPYGSLRAIAETPLPMLAEASHG